LPENNGNNIAIDAVADALSVGNQSNQAVSKG
jgi:hypothetical protein